jgi:phosphate transport system substrate-binding protein
VCDNVLKDEGSILHAGDKSMRRIHLLITLCLVTLGLVGVVVWSGCSGSGEGAKRLNGAGSSFVKPLMDEWAKVYHKEKGVEINYQSKGSSTGIEMMTNKSVDYGCTDAPMNDQQIKKAEESGAKPLHIPLAMGAVVPVYNLPGIEKPIRFTGPVLADIFRRKIKKWNDDELKKLNPKDYLGADLPGEEIKVVHRSDGSGTNYIFTQYLSEVSPEWKQEIKYGTSVNWPEGTVGERGSEGLSKYVQNTKFSIGYVELLYALKIKMGYGSVKNKDGEYIHADLDSVTEAAKGLTSIPDDLRYSIVNMPGKKAYPISGTVWAVVYDVQPAGQQQELVAFLRWVTHEGQAKAKELEYAPLPPGIVERIENKLSQIKAAK